MKNKILKLSLAIMLMSQSTFAIVVETCSEPQTVDYFPLGDTSGKSVLTKREVTKDCNLTLTAPGPCIAWQEKKQRFGVEPDEYNTYRSNDNEKDLTAMFTTMGAYDQIEHLWSGWHGYCEIGTKSDFDWANDPMYWASLATTVAMDYATAGSGTSAGETAAGQAASSTLNTASSAMVSGMQSVFASIGITLTQNMAECLIGAGVNMAFAAVSQSLADGDAEECDPVDEFCDEEVIPESDIFTMKVSEYDEIIANNPKAVDYIIIIPPQEGDIYTVRYKKLHEDEEYNNMSEEEKQKAQEEAKKMMVKIEMAMIAADLAMCGVTGNASGPGVVESGGNDDRASVKNGVSMAINAVPASMLGPYGPLIKGACQVILSVATSFKSIDSCNDKDDAADEGTRHEKTQQSLEYNLCHKTAKTCAEKKILLDGCALRGYKYCCYDQLLTKVLVEQIKAQLGRDWSHCTGISIKDLKYVSFRECDDADRNANGGTLIDGAHQVNLFDFPDEDNKFYDPEKSYQFVRKCIDMTEFRDSIKGTFNTNIDISDFKEDAAQLSK